MAKFRGAKTLQKFATVHTSIHNHFSHDRHLYRRDTFKNRSAARAEWRQVRLRRKKCSQNTSLQFSAATPT
jgi:putative transposase